jgi:hypothetical protein
LTIKLVAVPTKNDRHAMNRRYTKQKTKYGIPIVRNFFLKKSGSPYQPLILSRERRHDIKKQSSMLKDVIQSFNPFV